MIRWAGGPSLDSLAWDYAYDVEPTIMTHSATRAISEVSPSPSLYRAEQYDSDLGLYYLRARYYNPLTGRFLSRDPEEGTPHIPATLHKYLYANGDPVNHIDPRGRASFEEYLVEVNLDTFMGTESTVVMRQLWLKILACVAAEMALSPWGLEEDFWEACL